MQHLGVGGETHGEHGDHSDAGKGADHQGPVFLATPNGSSSVWDTVSSPCTIVLGSGGVPQVCSSF